MKAITLFAVAAIGLSSAGAWAKWPPIVQGTWKGQCVRPSKPPANVTLIMDDGVYTFGGGPLLSPDLTGKTLKFDVKGNGGTVTRRFFGTFSDSFESLRGTYSQPDGKQADCSLDYAG